MNINLKKNYNNKNKTANNKHYYYHYLANSKQRTVVHIEANEINVPQLSNDEDVEQHRFIVCCDNWAQVFIHILRIIFLFQSHNQWFIVLCHISFIQ